MNSYSSSSSSNESPETYLARRKLKEIFRYEGFEIEEEVPLDTVTNNMGEEIWPPYRADMIVTKQFIIELDSKKIHGTKRKITHDRWRDKNVRNQIKMKTVRLLSKDVNKLEPKQILEDIEWKLKRQEFDSSDDYDD